MVNAEVWTLIGLLATALFTLLGQIRATERSLASRLDALTVEMHRGFGEIRGDIAVLKAHRDGQ